MDKLEAFITNNIAGFNSDEPSGEHLERFKTRLYAKPEAQTINLWLVAFAAAVGGVVLTATLSLLLNYNGLTPPRKSGLASVNLSPEIIQIDEYYQQQVNKKQEVISMMMTGNLSSMEKEIGKTLRELNEGYGKMMNEIALSPRPERANFAITRYYQTQLDVLEGIILNLENMNTLKQ